MGIWRLPHRKDKKGKTRYQRIIDIHRNGRKIYKSKTFDTQKAGLKWERDFLYELESGLITKESLKKRKVSDVIQRYVSLILPKRPKNTRNVLQHLKWWGSQIGDLQLPDVTPALLAECRDRLLTEVGPVGKVRKSGTALRYIATMSAVFECCVKEWMYIHLNPFRSIKKPSAGRGKTRFFSLEEIHKIRDLCARSESPHILPIFLIALHSGMRKGEILGLRWEDLDFKNREIHLPTSKNGEPRDIPMTNEVYRILCGLSASKRLDISGLVFPSPNNPQRPVDIKSTWERILVKAGIDGTFHTIRHTACSYLAQLGISPILIARIVGHKDSRTTDRYTHAVKSHVHEAIGKLESLMSVENHAG